MNERTQIINELKKQFPNEQACVDYLYHFKWPAGYRCPKCGFQKSSYHAVKKYCRCLDCGHLTSMTAGTVLEGTRQSFCRWFWMIILISRQYDNVNIRNLQKTLQIQSYKTAWLMAHKIFQAMSGWDAGDQLVGLLWLHVPIDNVKKNKKTDDCRRQLAHIIAN